MRFNTKQEAQEYLEATYPEYALTGVYNVIMVGPMVAKFKKIKVGFYIRGEQE